MRVPGRKLLFGMVVGLLVIPGQVALIPLLRTFSGLQINGTFLALWLVHTGFGLSLYARFKASSCLAVMVVRGRLLAPSMSNSAG